MPDKDFKAITGSISSTMTKSQRIHLIETNKIAVWVDDNLILQNDSRLFIGSVPKSETSSLEIYDKLYPDYHQWCSDNGIPPLSVHRFSPSLADLCQHLRLPVTKLNRSGKGISFLGFSIRDKGTTHHIEHMTPITEQFLDDDDANKNQAPQIKTQHNLDFFH